MTGAVFMGPASLPDPRGERLVHEWREGRESYRARGEQLAVRAWRESGRWRLGLEVWTGGAWRSVLETPLDRPDASDRELTAPAFQECHARVRDGESVELLLVGQHGRRHFSGAVSVAAEAAHFDFADRWTVPLDLATIVYRWHPPAPPVIPAPPAFAASPVPPGSACHGGEGREAGGGGAGVNFVISSAAFRSPRGETAVAAKVSADAEGGLAIQVAYASCPLPPGTLQASWLVSVQPAA